MDILGPHKFSIRHRAALDKSTKAGCFFCERVYSPTEIVEWIDNDQTALCPHCGIDSVIGDADCEIGAELLAAMRRHWFW